MTPITVIANFKSHKTIDETLAWLHVVVPVFLSDTQDSILIVCPQFPSLVAAKEAIGQLGGTNRIKVGVQNVSAHPQGAYTGEVAAETLTGIVDYAIIGHSERRRFFHETPEDIKNKVNQLEKNNITPIVCVDTDTLSDAAAVKAGFTAFEPLAAIGTGQPENVETVRTTVQKLHSMVGQKTSILYGGSIDAMTVTDFLAIENLSGFLVGSTSLVPEQFIALLYAIRDFRRQTTPNTA